ncbi:RICIN domain-containing protein [Actinomadura harenae]|uniref:Ricin B lectin domain-containing protein n=1 Tax=Actinomadura harenae TaxID=2483351 RepID=A0A3M2M1M3_9ACTN|nr:ricin-type beta-trefoil lectin domain protein [Actinomadura harenae]RMI43342.1 hypothetical protein EBO15_16845 [Actinomadura harenae]
MRFIISSAFAGVTVAGLAVMSPEGTAAAAADPPPRSVVSVKTPYGCLTNHSGPHASMRKCAQGSRTQQWVWTPGPDKSVLLRNVATGRCLDGDRTGSVYTSPCKSDNRYEQWRTSGPDNNKQFYSVGTGRYLRANAFNNLYTVVLGEGALPTGFAVARVS